MSIRRVEVIDEGSPVRTPSRRILPDMSQWDMIPDPLHVRRSMEQENNHHHHHHQRHTGTEDLDRESSPEEADDKENSGNQRRPRSSTSSSQRSPLGEVLESDPRRSSERPFEAHPLSQEVFFSPSPAVGPSTTYNSSTNTAFVPAVTAMPARIPPPASSRTDCKSRILLLIISSGASQADLSTHSLPLHLHTPCAARHSWQHRIALHHLLTTPPSGPGCCSAHSAADPAWWVPRFGRTAPGEPHSVPW